MAHRVRGRGLDSCGRARRRRWPQTDPWGGGGRQGLGLLVVSLGHHAREHRRTPAGDLDGAPRVMIQTHAGGGVWRLGSAAGEGTGGSSGDRGGCQERGRWVRSGRNFRFHLFHWHLWVGRIKSGNGSYQTGNGSLDHITSHGRLT
jgi:hypothetical protein